MEMTQEQRKGIRIDEVVESLPIPEDAEEAILNTIERIWGSTAYALEHTVTLEQVWYQLKKDTRRQISDAFEIDRQINGTGVPA